MSDEAGNGKPYAIGHGMLRKQIMAAAATDRVPLRALTVLGSQRDPYRLDTPAGHKVGRWFGQQVAHFPHMLRHAAGYMLASDGHDTRLIQDFLGHVDIRHTAHYTAIALGRLAALRVR